MILSMNYHAEKYLELSRRLKKHNRVESLANLIRDVGFYQCMLINDKRNGEITEEVFNRIYGKYQGIMYKAINKIAGDIHKSKGD